MKPTCRFRDFLRSQYGRGKVGMQLCNLLSNYLQMKKLLIFCSLVIFSFAANAQVDRSEVLRKIESNRTASQTRADSAIIKSPARLFAERENLASVIMVIPERSTVEVLGSDDTYYHVVFEGNEGYVYLNQAEIYKPVRSVVPVAKQQPQVRQEVPVRQRGDRLTYLENKYGVRIGNLLYEGKAWKGMTSDMVKDSWGSPRKIDRTISGNVIKEQWFYRDTWLYIQNNVLAEWGRIK